MSSLLNFFRTNSQNKINIDDSNARSPTISPPTSPMNTSSNNLFQTTEKKSMLTNSMDGLFSRSSNVEIPNSNQNKESSYFRMLQVVEAGSL